MVKAERVWFVVAHFSLIVPDPLSSQLLDEYFRRAGEMVKASFVQSRGFDLLANQLKRHSVSVELLSALFSIALGGTVSLSASRLKGKGGESEGMYVPAMFSPAGVILPWCPGLPSRYPLT